MPEQFDPLQVLEHYTRTGPEAFLVLERRNAVVRVLWAAEAVTSLLGYTPADLLGEEVSVLERGVMLECGQGGGSSLELSASRATTTTLTAVRIDGQRVPLEASAVPVAGSGERWILTLRLSTDESVAVARLRASEERFRALSERAPIAIFSSEAGLRLGHVNDVFCSLFGATNEELVGAAWLARVFPEDIGPTVKALENALQGESQEWPMRVCGAGGALRWTTARVVPVHDADRGAGFIGTLEDVTDRREYEAMLSHQATHDPLTGLPNRAEMQARIATLLAAAQREGRTGPTVMFLDLDDFKNVNDVLGHNEGDRLLVEVAHRIVEAVRRTDMVARFGGDEFVVVCDALSDERLEELALTVLEATRTSISSVGASVGVSASVGVVVADGHESIEELLRDADVAMYQAKRNGKNCWRRYDGEDAARETERIELLADLRSALADGELEVHFQPITDIEDGSVTSIEALSRWQHRTRGMVRPDVFVELAETYGLVGELGRQVLDMACARMRVLAEEFGDSGPDCVSVNVSSGQLSEPGFVELVRETLLRHELTPEQLCLEITETAMMHDPARATEALGALRAIGVSIALDDFGTGHSSLSYLRDLPVNVLKIDKSFVDKIAAESGEREKRDRHILSSIVGLATGLGMRVVAEGVETTQQLGVLRDLGCPLMQGWLRAKAMPGDALARWLAEGHTENRVTTPTATTTTKTQEVQR